MSEKSNRQQEFEEIYKKEIFKKTDQLCFSQRKLISSINHIHDSTDLHLNIDIPNIGITFNNKLVEFVSLFKNAGLSMFCQPSEYSKLNFTSSFLGDALIFYMLDKVLESEKFLIDYKEQLESFIHNKAEKLRTFYSYGPIKKFFILVKCSLFDSSELDVSYSHKELAILNDLLSKYIESDNNLWNSNLRDIIVPSIFEHIKRMKSNKDSIKTFMDNSIIPALEKLGVPELIPEIKESIAQLFSSGEPSPELTSTTSPIVTNTDNFER